MIDSNISGRLWQAYFNAEKNEVLFCVLSDFFIYGQGFIPPEFVRRNGEMTEMSNQPFLH